MTLVGDRERDRAVRELRRHYAEGRLDETRLSERLDLVLRAQSRSEIAQALRQLPLRRLPSLDGIVPHVRHAFLVAVVGMVWLMTSFAIFVAFLVWVATHGPTLAAFLTFLLIWVAISGLLYRRTAVSRQRLRR
jgi:hypothetical protein